MCLPLTRPAPCGDTAGTVLETPQLAVTAPESSSGIFTSIGFAMAGSGQRYNTPRGKTASGLVAVSKYLPPLHWGGSFEKLTRRLYA